MTNAFSWTILKILPSSNLQNKKQKTKKQEQKRLFQQRNKDHGVQFNEQIV